MEIREEAEFQGGVSMVQSRNAGGDAGWSPIADRALSR